MSITRFDKVKVLIAEPNQELRKGIKDMLESFGFRDIIDTGNLGFVEKAIAAEDIDLLIGDTNLPEGDLSEVIYDIRHGGLGPNPFIVTFTLTAEPSSDNVNKMIKSGTDVVLVKPLDHYFFADRLQTLIQARKRFAVTANYIGPDRRGKSRENEDRDRLIPVPNPVQDKLSGYVDQVRRDRAIHDAMKAINELRVVRYGSQINSLLDKIVPQDLTLESGGTIRLDDEAQENLFTLGSIAHDFGLRLKDTRFITLTEMSLTLRNMTNALIASPDRIDPEDLYIISKLGRVIEEKFERDRIDNAAEKEKVKKPGKESDG